MFYKKMYDVETTMSNTISKYKSLSSFINIKLFFCKKNI
jgi:hypothetical protein